MTLYANFNVTFTLADVLFNLSLEFSHLKLKGEKAIFLNTGNGLLRRGKLGLFLHQAGGTDCFEASCIIDKINTGYCKPGGPINPFENLASPSRRRDYY